MKRYSRKILGKLQNGSDIRGVALKGVPGEEVNLSPEVARLLGFAFGTYLEKNGSGKQKVALGTDSRISGKALKAAFAEGCMLSGADVYDCGMASTPAMFMVTLEKVPGITGGVMLTASHLPFNRNGMKFFTSKGGYGKQEITELLNLAASIERLPDKHDAGLFHLDYMNTYSAMLVDVIRQGANDPENYDRPLRGMKIVLDAGNGAGGFFADKVLEPLGANTAGSQFLQPDGRFPNHIPNPEDPDAMAAICEAVKKEKADLGIIFDTDVDRSALVNQKGEALNRNELIALISSIVLEEHPGTSIVTDSITSVGLKKFIREDLKGEHHRFKRGYKNVINEAIRLNSEGKEAWLAIETSGHAALKENYFLDDGAYLVAKLLIQAAKMRREGLSLDSLVETLEKPVEEKEMRIKIRASDFRAYGEKVLDRIEEFVESKESWEREYPDFEGIRANFEDKAWFLLRLSLHDPLLALNLESSEKGGIEKMMGILLPLLKEYKELDI